MSKLYINETYPNLIIETGINLSFAQTAEIDTTKPDNTQLTWTATIEDAVAGTLKYEFQDGELDIDGVWIFQAKITFTDNTVAYGDVVAQRVYEVASQGITTLEKVKEFLGLDSTYDNQIEALIPLVEQQYLDIRNKPFDKDDEDLTVYPSGSDVTAALMIQHMLGPINADGKEVTSESIGNYSASYAQKANTAAYPAYITLAIKRYIKGA